jgi:hypothetical protein
MPRGILRRLAAILKRQKMKLRNAPCASNCASCRAQDFEIGARDCPKIADVIDFEEGVKVKRNQIC